MKQALGLSIPALILAGMVAASGVPTDIGLIVSTGENPIFLTVHPSGQFLYAVTEGTDTMTICSLNPTTGAIRQSS